MLQHDTNYIKFERKQSKISSNSTYVILILGNNDSKYLCFNKKYVVLKRFQYKKIRKIETIENN